MKKISIRLQRVNDAQRFCEILNNKNFIYFSIKPSLEEERKYLSQNSKKRKKNIEHNYTIIYDKKIAGAVGIKINQHSQHVGEIGYFIDENFWNKGIASCAVKLIEQIGFNELNLERIEIMMIPDNIGSVRVAEKCNYKREGLLSNRIFNDGKYHDAYLYAKLKKEYYLGFQIMKFNAGYYE
ncbi:MAG TPA: GNAT family protein [Spirochaetota bacterium]|nr:GNAT family protein [Spirochaetota bacterium]HOR45420.1 GNAT family protein [Spirochaetota bacterium]HPK57003.1 GNAT family protein [Spirochaetota bacterium]